MDSGNPCHSKAALLTKADLRPFCFLFQCPAVNLGTPAMLAPDQRQAPSGHAVEGVKVLYPSPLARRWHKPFFIVFLIWYAVNWMALLLGIRWPSDWRWVEPLLFLLGAATLLVGLGRRIPLQNVLLSMMLIIVFAGAVTATDVKTGIPFGPCLHTENLSSPSFQPVPWPLPFLWIVVIVSSRGVARLMMRPWRKTNYYGYWIIGLTMTLALLFDLGLEPFATGVKQYWLWRTPPTVPNWYSAPWTNFLGWAVVVLGILFITTPWLINKQPIKLPTDYHPLIVWLLWNGYFLTGNILHQNWPAVAVGLAGSAVAAVFAVRGGRW